VVLLFFLLFMSLVKEVKQYFRLYSLNHIFFIKTQMPSRYIKRHFNASD